eukprot:RCo023915
MLSPELDHVFVISRVLGEAVAEKSKAKLECSNVEVTLSSPGEEARRFEFDGSIASGEESSSQHDVFRQAVRPMLLATLEGTCCTVASFGAGSTYTMVGTDSDPGLVPRTCCELFSVLSAPTALQRHVRVEVSYLELLRGGALRCLLYEEEPGCGSVPPGPTQGLHLREHPGLGPWVHGLRRADITDFDEAYRWIRVGNQAQSSLPSSTSSGHAVARIFTLRLTQTRLREDGGCDELVSKLDLVDLGDFPRWGSSTGSSPDHVRLEQIVDQLSSAGTDKAKLARKRGWVAFEDSPVTWLLRDALGGTPNAVFLAALSPSDDPHALRRTCEVAQKLR